MQKRLLHWETTLVIQQSNRLFRIVKYTRVGSSSGAGFGMPGMFSPFSANERHVLAVAAHSFSPFSTNERHVLPITADGLPTFTTDGRHVFPVTANCLTSFASNGCSGFGIG
jgi:hypothetical protein